MSYRAFEDDDDHVYLNMLTGLVRKRAHIQIFTNHRPFINVGNEIYEYITNIYISRYECDYELDEYDGGIYLVLDDRFRWTPSKHILRVHIVIKLKKEVLLIEKLYCVLAKMAFDQANEGEICNTDKLISHDEHKLQKLTNEISDDYERREYRYVYYCKCNYTRCRLADSVTLYDEEDTVLYDGLGNKRIISDIVDKNHNKFLTFRCCHN